MVERSYGNLGILIFILFLKAVILSNCIQNDASKPITDEMVVLTRSSVNSELLTPLVDTPVPVSQILLVTGERYEYQHLFEIREYLDDAGYQTALASHTLNSIENMILDQPEEKIEIQADLLVSEVEVSDYKAVVLINDWAGFMTGEYPEIYDLIADALEENTLIAAYDYTPMLLGEAGVLAGVEVTSHISAHDTCMSLERSYGAICTGRLVVRDGNIITADGFRYAPSLFAQQVDWAVKDNEAAGKIK